MGKFIISESEKKQILNLYYLEPLNESNEVDHWVPVNVKINQKVTILDPSKYNNKIVFENMGITLTIIEVAGDVITATAYFQSTWTSGDEFRLQHLVKASGPQFSNTVRFKIDLSSAEEYQYTKLLNNKSLLNNLKSASQIGDRGSIEYLIKNVTDKNTSKIQFINFPDKKDPLTGSLPAGTVTIIEWFYDASRAAKTPASNYEGEQTKLSKEQKKLEKETKREYRKKFRQYKDAQDNLEDEEAKIPVELADTGTLKSALKALTGKIFNLGGRMYQIGKAEVYNNEIILKSDLQKTNTTLEKPKFNGGEYNFYLPCGRDFIKTDTSKNMYKDVSYGNTATEVDKDLIQDLKDYVCIYLG